MFIIGTDTFLISPLLTTLSSLYHIDTSISGWMVSAYTIAMPYSLWFQGQFQMEGTARK